MFHYSDVVMGVIASQITSLTIDYSAVYSDADQRKHQRTASPAFVRGLHRWPVNSPHKWPVTRKMFPFHDVIMYYTIQITTKFWLTNACVCGLISAAIQWMSLHDHITTGMIMILDQNNSYMETRYHWYHICSFSRIPTQRRIYYV